MTHLSPRNWLCPEDNLLLMERVEVALVIVAVARLAAEPAAITWGPNWHKPTFKRQWVANAAVARLPAEPAAMTLEVALVSAGQQM